MKILIMLGMLALASPSFATQTNTITTEPVTNSGNARVIGRLMLLGTAYFALSSSIEQGLLPCHERKNVLIDKGGYQVEQTYCQVNGFK